MSNGIVVFYGFIGIIGMIRLVFYNEEIVFVVCVGVNVG